MANRRGLAGIILIFLILVGDIITGAVSSRAPFSDSQTLQHGSSSCTIAIGSNTCNPSQINFSPVFAQKPKLSFSSNVTTINTQVTVPSFETSYFFSIGTDTIEGTWTSGMPAAQTEIFGDTTGNHWILVDWSNMAMFDFEVDCLTASTQVGATLQVQYSPDQGTTWTSIGTTLSIGSGVCPNMANNPPDTGYQTIPLAAQAKVLLRIVGAGGGGALDKPVFSLAYVIAKPSAIILVNALTFRVISDLTTSFQVEARLVISPVSNTLIKFDWTAIECITGSSC